MSEITMHAYGVRPGDVVILSDAYGETRILVTRVTADSTHIKITGRGGDAIVPREMKVRVA